MILSCFNSFISFLGQIKEPTHWIIFVSFVGAIMIWIRIIYNNKEIEERERR